MYTEEVSKLYKQTNHKIPTRQILEKKLPQNNERILFETKNHTIGTELASFIPQSAFKIAT